MNVEVDLRPGKHTMDYPENEMKEMIGVILSEVGVSGKVVTFLGEKIKGSSYRKGISVPPTGLRNHTISMVVQAGDNGNCFQCHVMVPKEFHPKDVFNSLRERQNKKDEEKGYGEEGEMEEELEKKETSSDGKNEHRFDAKSFVEENGELMQLAIAEHMEKHGMLQINGRTCSSVLLNSGIVGTTQSRRALGRIVVSMAGAGFLSIVSKDPSGCTYSLSANPASFLKKDQIVKDERRERRIALINELSIAELELGELGIQLREMEAKMASLREQREEKERSRQEIVKKITEEIQ